MVDSQISIMTKEEILAKQYDILGHSLVDRCYTEIRDIHNGRQLYVSSKDQFIKTASELLHSDIYVGINPRGVLGGLAEHVSYLTCLVIDIDPVRERGTGSTEEQLRLSSELGLRITSDFPNSVPVCSGSGTHVYFPIDPIRVDNRTILTDSVKAWMNAIKEKYATKELRIDPIFDLPRVIRIWGSKNTKSNRICAPTREYDGKTRFPYEFRQSKEDQKKSEQVVDPDVLARFNSLCDTNRRLRSIVRREITFPSRSESDFSFIITLADAGFTVDEICSLADRNPSGRGNHPNLRNDVERICKKAVQQPISRDETRLTPAGAAKSLRSDSAGYLKSLEERKPGIQTGLTGFDSMVSGLKPGKLYIFAARPNEGKTSLITQILGRIAEQGKSCLFYPTEVGAEPIYDKLVSSHSRVNLKKFQNGNFTPEEKTKVAEAVDKIKDYPLFIVEDFSVNIEKIEQGVRKHAPQVVAIDYFQAMLWNDPESVAEKSDSVYRLKKIAVDYNIPIILASQLNRQDGKASLSHLKSTGALEELGDVISFIYRTDKFTYPVPVDLLVMKSKYSATGLLRLNFYVSDCRFESDDTFKDENGA